MDVKVTVVLTQEEAVALAGVLGLIATVNALPDVSKVCHRLVEQVNDSIEKAVLEEHKNAGPDLTS